VLGPSTFGRSRLCTMPATSGTCPNCTQGDLITISMAVSGRDLMFRTCHLCEAKWWIRDGQEIAFASVIDTVVGS
jgi:DNA polymerase III alpha subunit (gram-positive type)